MSDSQKEPPSETSTNELVAKAKASRIKRQDAPEIDPSSIWSALSNTPGIGVSITDADGQLLFVNDTAQVLFSQESGVEYLGKNISDFHPPEFVQERLAMIRRVINERKPLVINHIYHGVGITSTVWPINDRTPPFNRVIVVTREHSKLQGVELENQIETVGTDYIDLGPLDVLSQRELEVLALLGHGLSVPRTAAILHRSPKTVERHKASISEKLQVHGQAELVAIVNAMGLDVSDAHLKRLSGIA